MVEVMEVMEFVCVKLGGFVIFYFLILLECFIMVFCIKLFIFLVGDGVCVGENWLVGEGEFLFVGVFFFVVLLNWGGLRGSGDISFEMVVGGDVGFFVGGIFVVIFGNWVLMDVILSLLLFLIWLWWYVVDFWFLFVVWWNYDGFLEFNVWVIWFLENVGLVVEVGCGFCVLVKDCCVVFWVVIILRGLVFLWDVGCCCYDMGEFFVDVLFCFVFELIGDWFFFVGEVLVCMEVMFFKLVFELIEVLWECGCGDLSCRVLEEWCKFWWLECGEGVFVGEDFWGEIDFVCFVWVKG